MKRPGFFLALPLLFICIAGCSREPREPEPVAAAGREPVEPVALEDCPADETPWQDALFEARDAGELEAFVERVTELATACPGLWAPHRSIAEALYLMRDRDKLPASRLHYRTAMDLAKTAGSAVGVARSATMLGGFSVRERDYAEAERIYREGLDAALELHRTDMEATLLLNYARVLRETGRFAEAIQALQRAGPLFVEHELHREALTAGYNESVMLLDLGNTAEARDRLEQVYATASEQDDARIVASSSIGLGNLHRVQDRLAEARAWFERVPDGDRRRFAELGLARIALKEGDFDAARTHANNVGGQGLVGAQARILDVEIALRRGEVPRAVELASRAVDEAADAGGTSTAFTSRAILGKSLLALGGREEEAIVALRRAVEEIEEQSAGLTVEQEGVAYLRERAEPYADLAAALAASGAPGVEVFDTVERAHARALRRVLRGTGRPAAATLTDVQAALEDRDVLLTYLVGHDRGTVVAVTRSGIEAHVIDGLATLRPLVHRLRRSILRPVASGETGGSGLTVLLERAGEMRGRLLGPVEHLLAHGSTRLLVVPDQDIALVPFAALVRMDTGEPGYLGDQVELAMLPMAGGAPRWGEPRLPLLLAGDPLPDGSGEFEKLPTSRRELAGISSLWRGGGGGLFPAACSNGGPVSRLHRARLTRETLLASELATFKTIHFATHAVASSLDPRRCAVILSGGEKLPMTEIAELDLDDALVVLSACRTGEGEIVPGEGVVGLTWAFLHAGAKGVAASLWSVEDESAAELMLAFHRFLKEGHDPVAALARAQRERRQASPHPAFWSPFVVVLKPRGA